jgi:hypothetical protein
VQKALTTNARKKMNITENYHSEKELEIYHSFWHIILPCWLLFSPQIIGTEEAPPVISRCSTLQFPSASG